jgi:thiol:disulfide interchange protein/DsbC/DsbD-like thiol-disulfide interchange protein
MLALALLTFTAAVARGQVYQGRELVKAELVADTSAIVPGKPFTAGLLLHIAPGWHTYWKFSGDAGIPIELKWKLPAGWKTGELHWPIPLKFDDPGDIKTYGYHDEVLVMQEITPPASLSDTTVKLSADASWLVCEKICIPGSASVQLNLPTGRDGAAANAPLFDRYRKLLPKDLPAGDQVSLSWSRSGNDLHLKVSGSAFARHAQVDFYPLPDEKIVVGHPSVESRTGDEVNFKIPIESGGEGLSALPGLLVFGENADGSDWQAWSVAASGNGAPANASATTKPLSAPARGLVTYLIFGFIGGFILNLMPCVLPVISLKIFGFIQQAGQSRQKILRSGLAFTAGIFVWFIGLALLLIVLKGAGHQISWAFQFTNAYFVLFMSAVVLVFALNLFGVFEISLPQSATRGLLGATAAEGDAASFFQGVFATVLATPCTAPFLGTALGFAFAQSGVIILAMFVAIAAGMSAPYLVLCAQPAWLRFLPRPGPWMVRMKQFMGFLLLATLLFLLYVLGAQRGLDALIWASCFLLIVSVVCWMKGAFVTPVASARGRTTAIVLMLVLLVASGFYFIGGKFAASKLADVGTSSTGEWQPFTPARLESELKQGHAVFVDFTAAWCITCKFNEASVLETAAVRESFERHGITRLKADWTNGDPDITKLLQHFGRPGVPLYVLYPGGQDEPIVFPELLTKGILLDKLETISRTVASH